MGNVGSESNFKVLFPHISKRYIKLPLLIRPYFLQIDLPINFHPSHLQLSLLHASHSQKLSPPVPVNYLDYLRDRIAPARGYVLQFRIFGHTRRQMEGARVQHPKVLTIRKDLVTGASVPRVFDAELKELVTRDQSETAWGDPKGLFLLFHDFYLNYIE